MTRLHFRGPPARSLFGVVAGTVAGFAFTGFGCGATETTVARNPQAMPPLDYPKTKSGDQVDDYHGTKVADP